MDALRALPGLAGTALLFLALLPGAAAYTCTPLGQKARPATSTTGVPDF